MRRLLNIELRQIYYGVGYTVHHQGNSAVLFAASSVEDAISASTSRWFSDEPVDWQITDLGYGLLGVTIELQGNH